MKFKLSELESMRAGGNDELEQIEESITSHGRWSVGKRIVFAKGDCYYEWLLSDPATEQQDCGEWGDRDIECKQVTPVCKYVTVYE